METEYEVIKKYLPMIFELDFNTTAPAVIHKWHAMSWNEFQKVLVDAGINCNDCKIRNWESFFHTQHVTLNKLQEDKLNLI